MRNPCGEILGPPTEKDLSDIQRAIYLHFVEQGWEDRGVYYSHNPNRPENSICATVSKKDPVNDMNKYSLAIYSSRIHCFKHGVGVFVYESQFDNPNLFEELKTVTER